MLKIQGLDVNYGNIQAVRNISLEVNDGELVALLGSNGAGKTTILRTISGLLKAKKGTISFNDKIISQLPTQKIVEAGLIHVPEGRQIFGRLNVYENLKLGAYLSKDNREFQKNLEYVYDSFPILNERGSQTAGTLSGGEQQMLAIGRALMSNPKILLLDEPSLGLAPIVTDIIFDVIKKLNNKGITILLVEQNAFSALEISDRAYVLETGNIKISGKSSDILNNPEVKKAYLGG